MLSKYDAASQRNDEEGTATAKTMERMAKAYRDIIECTGASRLNEECLTRTPHRAAKALCFFTKGYEEDLKSEHARMHKSCIQFSY